MMEVMASQMSAILLGHSGENGAVRVAFDLTAFQKAFPGGQPLLLVRRYADTTAYPAPLTVEEQTAYWTVGAADTARAGYGQCELQWYLEDGTLAKSDLFDFLVLGTLKTDAAPPDAPSRRWFEAIRRQLGDLSKLTTQAKENLVAAINEAAKTGSGSAGSAALRVSEGYIQFRNGDGWENLIAKSELEGTKGEPGEDGETPTIGENGNWYIGPEDTGKPSRGAPGAAASDAQVSSAVDTWLTEHPEATTTVQDGSVSVEKLGYGKHIYGSKPYFCNSVGSGAASFGSIGVVVPCKAGDTIYCNFNMSPNGAYQKPQLLAALPENQYGAIAPIGTIEKDDTTKAYTVPESATTAKAMYLPQSFNAIPAANNGSVEDALAWINKTMGTDGSKCAQNVPFEDYDAWYQTAQAELFDIDERCNKLMYASLYQAVSKLVGAKVAVLGDSLTEQSACSFITSAYNDRWMENVLRDTARTGDDGKTYKGSGWFALIARKYKIKWWCAGHGMQWWYSTTERPNGATAMVRKLIDGTDEFDYIVLEYGTNDILSGYTHIGTAADEASETATTSCGAIKWCIEQLQTRFPEASIVVILPNIHSGANGEAPATQQAYLDAVVPILKKYSVRYVNMAEDSGIVKSMMYTDGVHLRWPVVRGGVTYYTNDTPAVRKFSKCLEAELLKA
ncbi:MAG: SGNH/GDSL hydrolase family protein [Oscillospiraceae bacterium]|nr:SGNH/GDSL hydrolase family protein [Oscillospiraceae bacterium]